MQSLMVKLAAKSQNERRNAKRKPSPVRDRRPIERFTPSLSPQKRRRRPPSKKSSRAKTKKLEQVEEQWSQGVGGDKKVPDNHAPAR